MYVVGVTLVLISLEARIALHLQYIFFVHSSFWMAESLRLHVREEVVNFLSQNNELVLFRSAKSR